MRASAGRHLINQFLAEMDGIKSSNDGVLILAATNAPWHVDAAFRRPGRFDQILFVPPPDGPARASILRILLKGKPVADIDHDAVAKKTDGFSGADLKAVVDVAIEAKLKEAMKVGPAQPADDQGPDDRRLPRSSRVDAGVVRDGQKLRLVQQPGRDVRRHPEIPEDVVMDVVVAKANALYGLGRYAEADLLLSHLPSLQKDVYALATLSLVRSMLNDRAAAIKFAKDAIKVGPNEVAGYRSFGWALYLDMSPKSKRGPDIAVRHMRQAKELVRTAIGINNHDPSLFALSGFIQLSLCEHKPAAKAALDGLALDPTNADCLRIQAQAAACERDYDVARRASAACIKSFPESGAAFEIRGYVMLLSGRCDEAVTYYREALRLSPSSDSAKTGLLSAHRGRSPLIKPLIRARATIGWNDFRRLRPFFYFVFLFLAVFPVVVFTDPANPSGLPARLRILLWIVMTVPWAWLFCGPAVCDLLLLFDPDVRVLITRVRRVVACIVSALTVVVIGVAMTALALGDLEIIALIDLIGAGIVLITLGPPVIAYLKAA